MLMNSFWRALVTMGHDKGDQSSCSLDRSPLGGYLLLGNRRFVMLFGNLVVVRV